MQVRHNPANSMSIQIQRKSLRHQNLQLIEAMSSQLSIFHLHMTCFSSWLSGDFVCKLANFREAVSKIHSIVVRRATAPDEVAAKREARSRASADLQSAHS
jgi:hypothetical protein